jgi:hypothetical protein
MERGMVKGTAGRLLAAAMIWGAAQTGAAAQALGDGGTAIRAVIAAQLERFAVDDWTGAFRYASPEIQRAFRTPEAFARMVRDGYPMVWRPLKAEPGPLEPGPRGPVQTMFFRGPDRGLYIADYEMALVDGAWRIAGVRVRPAPDLSS